MKYVVAQAGESTLIVPEGGGEAVAKVFKPEFADMIAQAVTAASFVPAHPIQEAQHEPKVCPPSEGEWHCGSDSESEFFWCKPRLSADESDVLWFSTILDAQTACNALNGVCARPCHPQWQDIRTAPKDGRWLLVSDATGIVYVVSWSDAAKDWEDYGSFMGSSFMPIYWMPLPLAPQSNNREA